jgi:hypothetical protein
MTAETPAASTETAAQSTDVTCNEYRTACGRTPILFHARPIFSRRWPKGFRRVRTALAAHADNATELPSTDFTNRRSGHRENLHRYPYTFSIR